jgi:hypothetical protein
MFYLGDYLAWNRNKKQITRAIKEINRLNTSFAQTCFRSIFSLSLCVFVRLRVCITYGCDIKLRWRRGPSRVSRPTRFLVCMTLTHHFLWRLFASTHSAILDFAASVAHTTHVLFVACDACRCARSPYNPTDAYLTFRLMHTRI